jgi:hypothetical protein
VRTHSLKALAVIVCLLLCAAPAFSRGSAEAGLKEVEGLIAARDYGAAQKLLVDIRRRNPELVDPTQALLDRIMAHEREYNSLRRSLLEAIDNRDIDAAEQLVVRMEESDPHKPLAYEKAQIKDLRAARGVGAYMDTILALLEKGSYAEAIAAYLAAVDNPAEAGFAGQRDAFLALKDAALYVNGVQNVLAGIRTAAAAAAAADGAVRAVSTAVQGLPSGSAPERAAADYARAAAPLKELAAREAEIRRLADQLEGIDKALQSAGRGEMEDLYPRYMLILIQGREGRDEGILGAVRLLWEQAAAASTQAAVDLASTTFEAALRAYDGVAKSGDPAALAGAAGTFLPAAYRGLAAVEAGRLLKAAGWTLTTANRAELERLRAAGLAGQEGADESSAFRSLIEVQQAAAGLPPIGQPSVQARKVSQELAVRADNLRLEWRSRSDRWPGQAEPGMDGAALSKAALQMSDRFAALAEELRRRDLNYAVGLARAEIAGFEPRYASSAAARLRGEDLLNGTRGGKPSPDPGEAIPRQPSQALDSFDAAQKGFDALARDAQAWTGRWGGDLPLVVQSPGMRSLASQVDDLLSRLAEQAGQVAALAARAEESVSLAERGRREAESAYVSAGKALDRGDVETADRQAGIAMEQFISSLEYEYNAQADRRQQTDIPALRARIGEARFKQELKAVDDLTNEAIAAFEKERYYAARQSLEKAKATLQLLSRGQDERYKPYRDNISAWEKRVSDAIAASRDRILDTNDPRVDVTSPLLSRANETYADAERVSAEADRLRSTDPKDPRVAALLERRNGLLSQADAQVASVLAVAGNYAEARVLQYRISKLRNPAGFQKEVRDAVSLAGRVAAAGSTRSEQTAAMNALADYDKVVDDKALRAAVAAALRQLQQKVYGISLPTSEQLAQWERTVTEARGLLRREDPATYDGAIVRLTDVMTRASAVPQRDITDAAGRVLPEQTRARAVYRDSQALRQQFVLLRDAPTAGGLRKQDEARYQEALSLLNAGGGENELKSWDIVQDLLRFNRDYPPLLRMAAVLRARLRL